MATITWLDKIDGSDAGNPQKNVNAADMNLIKSVVNANDSATAVDIAAVQAEIDAHEALTSNPHNVTKSQIGLGNVDNTSDANKPVSTAQQTALDLKANIANPTFTTGITTPLIKITSGSPGSGKVLTSDADGDGTWIAPTVTTVDAVPTNGSTNPVMSDGVFDSMMGLQSDINLRAPIANPTFTGVPAGPTASPGTNTTQLATTAFVEAVKSLLPLLTSFVDNEVPSGSINDVNVTFTLANTPVSGSVKVYWNGMRMKVAVGYTISGSTITMTLAPATGDTLVCDYRK